MSFYVTVSVKYLDALGVEASYDDVVMAVDDTQTLTDLETDVQSYIGLVDAVSDAQIIEITSKVSMVLPDGIKTSPVEGSEVERIGRVTFDQATIPAVYSTVIPALSDEIVVGGKIDTTNTHFLAYMGWFTGAHVVFTPVTKARNVFIGPLYAMVAFRKHRKTESKRSYVALDT